MFSKTSPRAYSAIAKSERSEATGENEKENNVANFVWQIKSS